ncbi:MAG TPA: S8 family peptidase, partial [Oceanipulchritudo sp.]|nr:S8 family peptidase [Oceanipulchritudo sp.]
MHSFTQNLFRLPLLILIVLSAVPPVWAGFPAQDSHPQKAAQRPAASGEILLAKLKPSQIGSSRLSATLRANGVQVAREIKSVPGLRILQATGNARSQEANANGLKRRIAALMATGLFEYVEPDWQVNVLQPLPTDSSFTNGDLWGLQNTGQNGGVAGIDVNAVSAWDISTGSPSVIVGVIDTGIRYTHQDIAGNMWMNPGEIPGNGIDDDLNGYIDDVFGINAITGSGDPMDDHDHGTHVAGTIAATAFDSGSHVGVAYNARLMGLKFLDDSGNGSISAAIACIDYAIANGVDIINASWGGPDFSQALKDAIEAANAAGILFVAAAGNAASNNDTTALYPANFDVPNIISVAAIDRTGELA